MDRCAVVSPGHPIVPCGQVAGRAAQAGHDGGVSDVVRTLADRVRARVVRDGVDLSLPGGDADRYVFDEVRQWSERALVGSHATLADERRTAREVLAELTGYGPLQPFFDDPNVEEIWVNGPSRIFIAKAGVAELTKLTLTDRQLRALVERMLQHTGRRVDLSSPFVDASLPDGSRLHVAIPDVTREWSVNIRKFHQRIRTLAHLVQLGALTNEAAAFLETAVAGGANVLVAGPTHTGKTTMLNALLSSVGDRERIVTVEETFELEFEASDVVAMQCRQPSLEGSGEITLRRLIKEALRMRPDRLVVGEVREAESLDLLIALNAGLPGMCTVHANSARDALAKLCTLPLLAGRNIVGDFVVPTVAGCIDVVVQLGRGRDGSRHVAEIVCPTGEVIGSTVPADSIFVRRSDALVATGAMPARPAKFEGWRQ